MSSLEVALDEEKKFLIGQERLSEVKAENKLFIKTMRDEKTSYEPPKKKPRTKAHETGMAIDKHMATFVSPDRGLGFFIMDEEQKNVTAPWLWSHLWLGQDLGADGNAFFFWLAYDQKANVTRISDESHGNWNVGKRALRKSKLWAHTLMMTVMHSLHYRPWQDCTYWQYNPAISMRHMISFKP